MSNEKPKCPYCGSVMTLIDYYGDYFYRCDACIACSPEAKSAEKAYEMAMSLEGDHD